MPAVRNGKAPTWVQPMEPNVLTSTVDTRRLAVNSLLLPTSKSELGQFMTPASVATFMTSLFSPTPRDHIQLLDPGAGVGSLTAAFVQRICTAQERPSSLSITAYEIDPILTPALKETLEDCVQTAAGVGIAATYQLIGADFVHEAVRSLAEPLFGRHQSYTHVITNPPYKKIASNSAHRILLRSVGIEATNLYAAFVALCVKTLAADGEIVAITPRSFCNGPYFLPFRRLLLSCTGLRHIHSFEARDVAFQDDFVLQENVIFHAVNAQQPAELQLSTSPGIEFQSTVIRCAQFTEVVHADDRELMIHLPANEVDLEVVGKIKSLTHSLVDLGLAVSTGPVVDFRLRHHIHQYENVSTVPLIYPAHFQAGTVVWPRVNGKKPNAIDNFETTRKWLMPSGYYTLTRRFSSKEERRRIVAAVFDPNRVLAEHIGFENHLNVYHARGKGLAPLVARGLALYLNSTVVDQYFRLFNGHTQVNASDLRSFPYPSLETLAALGGDKAAMILPTQEEIDDLVDEYVFPTYVSSVAQPNTVCVSVHVGATRPDLRETGQAPVRGPQLANGRESS